MNNTKATPKPIDQTTYENTKRNSRQQGRQPPSRHVVFENSRRQEKFNPRHGADTFRSRPLSGAMNGVASVDHWIGQGGGTTSTLEFLPHRLKISKAKTTVTMEQRIEELTRENGYLRQELAYHKDTQVAIMGLYDSAKTAVRRLQESLEEASRRIAMSENRLLEYWTIRRGDHIGGFHESQIF